MSLTTLDPNTIYSITIVDEELLGQSVVLCWDNGTGLSNQSVSFEEFISLTNNNDLQLCSSHSKLVYKTFPHLIKLRITIKDIRLASYINNGTGQHEVSAIADLFGIEKEASLPELTLTLYSRWEGLLTDEQKFIWDIENQTARVLSCMELDGITIDGDTLRELKTTYEKDIETLTKEIRELLNDDQVNINSNKQLGIALMNAGFKLGKPGKSGAPSVKESVLEKLSAKDGTGVISKILEYRTVQKMNSTYTDSLLTRMDESGRIHGEYVQTVAATGRLSSTNPNLQNIPIRHPKYGPQLRSVFVAAPGYTLISADYSQFELRILAHLCQDPRLLEAFKKDEDIHAVTASEIFGVAIDEVSKEQRGVGKTLNFALMYQQGHTSTAKQLGVSNAEAKKYHDTYFEKFANVKPYIESNLEEATTNGYAETMYGRRAYYLDLQSNIPFIRAYAERAAFNMPIQGAEADLVKMAMIELEKQILEQGLGLRMLLQIHDEIVFEVPDGELEKALPIIQKAMELNQPLTCPLKVEIHHGANWNEAK